MPGQIDFLILVGPNGVGKSHVGIVLARHFLCEYVSVEGFFKDRYPDADAFRSDQTNAYVVKPWFAAHAISSARLFEQTFLALV